MSLSPEVKTRFIRSMILCGIALAVGAAAGIVQLKKGALSENATVINKSAEQPNSVAGIKPGGAFTLTDQDGKTVTEKDFESRYKLVYFGFTSCPMICPTGLQKIARALNEIGPAGDSITPILITVDPERDTPPVMKQYVAQFHPRLIGLTGTKEQIESVEKSYRVYASKVQDEGATDYTMDHSGFTYLLGPGGDLLALYHSEDTAEQMAADIRTKIPHDGVD